MECILWISWQQIILGSLTTIQLQAYAIHIGILLPLAFTNAIFVDAERDGEKWLKEWKEEQSRYKLSYATDLKPKTW